MTENLKLVLEANKTYEDWGSYNDGTTFDISTGETCAATGTCMINANTPTTGGWYSWYAATGGKGTSTDMWDVDGSICPSGWKLPYNYNVSTNKSYQDLVNKYSAGIAQKIVQVPLSFIFNGFYGTSDTNGQYRSSTSYNGGAYIMSITTGGPIPQNNNGAYKYYNAGIRCVNI